MLIDMLLVLALVLIFFQDLKYRAIHILLPLLVFGIGIFQFANKGLEVSIILMNLGFLGFTLFGSYGYLVIKNRKWINPFNAYIGLGDVLFFVAVLPYFFLVNYMLYLVTGLLFSMLSFAIMRFFKQTDLVPLAGLLALYMIVLKVICLATNFDFFSNVIH